MLHNVSRKRSQDRAESRELSLVIGPTEVADVMTGKVVSLSAHHDFSDAVNLMNDRYFRHCVVVDSHGRLVGVISDRDILRALAPLNLNLDLWRAQRSYLAIGRQIVDGRLPTPEPRWLELFRKLGDHLHVHSEQGEHSERSV